MESLERGDAVEEAIGHVLVRIQFVTNFERFNSLILRVFLRLDSLENLGGILGEQI